MTLKKICGPVPVVIHRNLPVGRDFRQERFPQGKSGKKIQGTVLRGIQHKHGGVRQQFRNLILEKRVCRHLRRG